MKTKVNTPYSKEEELLNIITHGLGLLLSVIASAVMIYYARKYASPLAITSVSVYGGSLVLLYAASTIYHAVHIKRWKDFFRKVDKLCIYLLIAGTYTPVLLLGIGGTWGWVLLSVIWAMAALGFVFQFSPLHKSERWSLFLYAGMGWLAIVAAKPMFDNLSLMAILYLLIGGILYTSGIYFYAQDKIRFNHAIWHVFVLGGSITHFIAIFFFVM